MRDKLQSQLTHAEEELAKAVINWHSFEFKLKQQEESCLQLTSEKRELLKQVCCIGRASHTRGDRFSGGYWKINVGRWVEQVGMELVTRFVIQWLEIICGMVDFKYFIGGA